MRLKSEGLRGRRQVPEKLEGKFLKCVRRIPEMDESVPILTFF
jgi:hypothetical protein